MSRPDGRGDHAEQQPTERLATVWGPLSMRTTSVVGAHAPVSSFVVQPALAAELEAALCAEVLRDALPGPDETLETLLQRLRRSDVFDNPRVVYARRTRHGFFMHQSDQTPHQGGQARRVTFAELSGQPFVNESGDLVGRMRGYVHLDRHREDRAMCRPMPDSLRSIRDALYSKVRAPASHTH